MELNQLLFIPFTTGPKKQFSVQDGNFLTGYVALKRRRF